MTEAERKEAYLAYQRQMVKVDGAIPAPEVRVIDHDGEQLGVLPTGEAIQRAQEQGMNLLCVSPASRPPVCRIASAEAYFRRVFERGPCCCWRPK